ncbi:hypothetical protein [Bradyrhizobium sp. LB11.1]|uniref:hypothetical protein n=1 Tax=Bradyrhizobium sp. LB11.1 TaxID=3156326 RepID=UPI00339A35FC
MRPFISNVTLCNTTLSNLTRMFGAAVRLGVRRGPHKLTGFMMCTLTQRELDFLASLKTGWRLLYRRELMRLIRGDIEAGEAQPETRAINWRIISN